MNNLEIKRLALQFGVNVDNSPETVLSREHRGRIIVFYRHDDETKKAVYDIAHNTVKLEGDTGFIEGDYTTAIALLVGNGVVCPRTLSEIQKAKKCMEVQHVSQ